MTMDSQPRPPLAMLLLVVLVLVLVLAPTSGCDRDDPADDDDSDAELITDIDNEPGGNPLVPHIAMFPFPSDFYLVEDASTATGRRVALSDEAMPEGLEADTFADADGFSRASAMLTHLEGGIDPTSLPDLTDTSSALADDSSVWLLTEDSWERVPILVETDLTADNPDIAALIIRPQTTLEPDTGYVVVLRDTVRSADGVSTPPVSEAFRALRDGIATDCDEVEAQRDDFVLVADAIAGAGLAPEEVILAWSFHTRSEEQVLAPLIALQDHAWDWELGDWQITSDAWDDDGEQRLIYGEFEVPDFLGDEGTVQLEEDGSPVVHGIRTADFLVTVPLSASEQTRPVVVFGHGFFSAIEEPTWSSEKRALERWALPFVTTSFIGFCEDDQFETFAILAADLNRTDEIASQQMQSHANFTVLARLIQDELAAAITSDGGVPLLDATTVHYMGVSNGGTQGLVLMTASPAFDRGALVVPGGAWTHMLQRATPWLTMGAMLQEQYNDPREMQLAFSLIQLELDPVDSVNWVQHLAHDRLPGRPEVVVTLHEAVGDCQVSNMVTEWVARAGDIPLVVPTPRDVWDGADVPAALFIYDEGYPPLPDGNDPPPEDNGAHETVVDLDSYLTQVGAFLEHGTIAQVCDGACDPD